MSNHSFSVASPLPAVTESTLPERSVAHHRHSGRGYLRGVVLVARSAAYKPGKHRRGAA